MTPEQAAVVLRRLEAPDEVREMEPGRFALVTLGGTTLGRATCQPGWRWSLHVDPAPAPDSWVVGDLPYVPLHFLGARGYAR